MNSLEDITMIGKDEHLTPTMSSAQPTINHLTTVIEDYHSLNPQNPPILPYPTPIEFSKQVSKGLPCVYILPPSQQFCPAQSWTRASLINAIKEPVEVALTPNGRADSLQKIDSEDGPVFLQPATVDMTLTDLFEKFDGTQPTPVYYLQSQNGNLNSSTPLSPLLNDLPASLPFANPVLGSPEAINIWIGTSTSVTSTHRDPYENLYLVLRGSKTFILYAPVDELALCSRLVRTGRYVYDSQTGEFSTTLDDPVTTIPWIPVDPLLPYKTLFSQFPLYKHAHPQQITVHENQILYLPAGWFHHVEQESGTWDDGSPAPCIAVNYWHDMDYEGEKYAMRQCLGRMVAEVQALEQGKKELVDKIRDMDVNAFGYDGSSP
jgi:jumonji domain-containing protein 7